MILELLDYAKYAHMSRRAAIAGQILCDCPSWSLNFSHDLFSVPYWKRWIMRQRFVNAACVLSSPTDEMFNSGLSFEAYKMYCSKGLAVRGCFKAEA